MLSDFLVMLARVLIASVFVIAGALKIREGGSFRETVNKFGILPQRLVSPVAWLLPWVEICAGIALFIGVGIPFFASLIALMSLAFLLASISAMKRRLSIECNCFGLLYRERIDQSTLMRDLVLVLLAGSVAAFDHGAFSLSTVLSRREAVDLAALSITLVAAGLSAGVAYGVGKSIMSHQHEHPDGVAFR